MNVKIIGREAAKNLLQQQQHSPNKKEKPIEIVSQKLISEREQEDNEQIMVGLSFTGRQMITSMNKSNKEIRGCMQKPKNENDLKPWLKYNKYNWKEIKTAYTDNEGESAIATIIQNIHSKKIFRIELIHVEQEQSGNPETIKLYKQKLLRLFLERSSRQRTDWKISPEQSLTQQIEEIRSQLQTDWDEEMIINCPYSIWWQWILNWNIAKENIEGEIIIIQDKRKEPTHDWKLEELLDIKMSSMYICNKNKSYNIFRDKEDKWIVWWKGNGISTRFQKTE